MITDPIKKEYKYTHIKLSWECSEIIEVDKILEALYEYSGIKVEKEEVTNFGIKWDDIQVYTEKGRTFTVTFAQMGILPQDNISHKDPDIYVLDLGGETSTSST